ncbi:putative porin [Psychroserpens algicola]|uniref:putative porin n=1 Tax=Psychroserpens algicola TaxID=1719034 RepID=UPI001953ABA4|nr:putative porin [Psychroserpens algicola]
MKNISFLVILFFNAYIGFSQVRNIEQSLKRTNPDTISSDKNSTSRRNGRSKINKDATIDLYKIISYRNDTTYVDTSLTIKKEYKFNYLRKDDFGLIPFANIGQTYNQLTKDVVSNRSLPQFGARGRHFNYMEVEDIFYYEVPTPLTELFFKTAFQQGQLLDAFFTVNTSKQFNFSIAYKGLRSLGNYQHAITSTGNLRFTTNYKTKNEKYVANAHIVTQDLLNEENGGLQDEDLISFTSGDEDFIDRAVFEPNFQNAENILVGKRFYLNHRYYLIQPNDSLSNSLAIRNVVNFEDKYFQFDQTTSSDFFGDSFKQNSLRDKVTLENFETQLMLDYKNLTLGDIGFGVFYNDINYGYDKVTILNNELIRNRIKDKILGLRGDYSKRIGEFELNSQFGVNMSGDFKGSYFLGGVDYKFSEDLSLKGSINFNSSAPNYNLLLNQSNYINYNWDNTDSFENQNNVDFKFELQSDKLLDISFQYTTIDNFSLFALDDSIGFIKPKQIDGTINLFKIKINKELKFGKFALDNSLLYQNVNDESQSLNLPDFVVRNTFYYSNHFFKNNALFLQTGITFNYFTDYYMDGYDPLLAEFYSQTQTKMSGFPRLDFFVNAKIRQTRIFLKAEHFNSSFTGYDYFSAPNNPYRDFTVRFGLVWNFFL